MTFHLRRIFYFCGVYEARYLYAGLGKFREVESPESIGGE